MLIDAPSLSGICIAPHCLYGYQHDGDYFRPKSDMIGSIIEVSVAAAAVTAELDDGAAPLG